MKLILLAVFVALASAELQTLDLNPRTQGIACNACRALFDFVEKQIETNTGLLNRLEQAGNAFCQQLPVQEEHKKTCKDTVHEAVPKIVQALRNHFPPSTICADLMRCPLEEGNKAFAVNEVTAEDFEAQYGFSELKCDGCHIIFRFLNSFITTQKNQQTITNFLSNVCKIVPAKLHDNCEKLFKEHSTQLINKLAELLNENKLCYGIKFCPSDAPSKMLLNAELTEKLGFGKILCGPCKWAVEEASKFLQKELPIVLSKLDAVCDTAPLDSLKEACHQIVQDYGQQVGQQLLKFLTPENACVATKLCAASQKMMGVEEVDAQLSWSQLKCEGCELLLDFTAKELKDKTLQTLITTYVTAACNLVPPVFTQACQVISTKYLPKIFDELSTRINAEVFCKKIKICPAETRKESFLRLLTGPQAKALPKNILCTPCKWAVDKFIPVTEKYLPQLISEVSTVCTVLPPEVQASCTQTLQEFGERIAKNILEKLASQAVCEHFGACKKDTTRVVSFDSFPLTTEEFQRKFGSQYLCDGCKKFFGFLEKRVTDPQFVQNIENTFHQVCNGFGTLAEQCNKLVDQYLPQALKKLAASVDPNTVCPQLHLCP